MDIIFSLMVRSSGLTCDELVQLLDDSIDKEMVNKWISGEEKAPPHIVYSLAELREKIEVVSDRVVESMKIEISSASTISLEFVLPLSESDKDAALLNVPSALVHKAIIARVVQKGILMGASMKIVPMSKMTKTEGMGIANVVYGNTSMTLH